MQDWVQIAQREEQHRRALEAQLEAQQAASGGAPPTPTKQQSNDAAAREVQQLQAQLTTVKADAESKLGSLRAELEGQQAAASQNRAEMESLRARHAVAGMSTPPSPLFLGRFSPVLRRFSAVLLWLPGAKTERTGEKWRKMGEIWGRNGRETAVAEWRWTQSRRLSSCARRPRSPRWRSRPTR